MMRCARLSLFLILILAAGEMTMDAQQTTSNAPAAEASAITAIVSGLTEAWNKGDAQAFAAHYAAEGSFTNIVGMTAFGREGFVKQHERIFATIYKGSHVDFAVDRIHMVRPDVAIADVTCRLSGVAHFPPGIQPGPDGVLTTKLQLVLSRNAGQWQIDGFHNVAVTPLPAQN